MRVVFEFRTWKQSLVLPLHYNSLLQGMVYALLAGTEVATFLHDRGFGRGPRRYKLFTFSRLEGPYKITRGEGGDPARGDAHAAEPGASRGIHMGVRGMSATNLSAVHPEHAGGDPGRPVECDEACQDVEPAVAQAAAPGVPSGRKATRFPDGDSGWKGAAGAGQPEPRGSVGGARPDGQVPDAHDRIIRFGDRVRFTLSSPYEPVCHAAATRALQLGEVRLGNQILEVEAVRFEALPSFTTPVHLRARTPITVYSTVDRPDGSRFTYYFEPRSGEFERLVAENLVRKWEAYTDQPYEGPGVQVHWRGRARGHVVRFRRGVVKGYTGVFQVDGDPRLIALGLEAGFGSKNAQGFGFCDPVEPATGRRKDGAEEGGAADAD